MISRRNLTGWLVIMRYNLSVPAPVFYLPLVVREAFLARGWVEERGICDDGGLRICMTERGKVEADLAAPEWGIDPLELRVESTESDIEEA